MYQTITLIGNIGGQPELRYTGNGTAYTKLSLAVNKVFNDKDGTKQQQTTWFRCTAWGRQAEVAAQYVATGDLITLRGEMQAPSAWIDAEGKARASNEFRIEEIKLMGNNHPADGLDGTSQGVPSTGNDNDIPF